MYPTNQVISDKPSKGSTIGAQEKGKINRVCYFCKKKKKKKKTRTCDQGLVRWFESQRQLKVKDSGKVVGMCLDEVDLECDTYQNLMGRKMFRQLVHVLQMKDGIMNVVLMELW